MTSLFDWETTQGNHHAAEINETIHPLLTPYLPAICSDIAGHQPNPDVVFLQRRLLTHPLQSGNIKCQRGLERARCELASLAIHTDM